jgi:hypothetical protein
MIHSRTLSDQTNESGWLAAFSEEEGDGPSLSSDLRSQTSHDASALTSRYTPAGSSSQIVITVLHYVQFKSATKHSGRANAVRRGTGCRRGCGTAPAIGCGGAILPMSRRSCARNTDSRGHSTQARSRGRGGSADHQAYRAPRRVDAMAMHT